MKKIQLRLPWAPRPSTRGSENDSTEYLKNIPSFGKKMQDKEKGTYRFAFQNINGIKTSKEHLGVEEIGNMAKLKIDALGLAETNVNWSHDARSSFLAATYLKFNSSARACMSSCYTHKEGYWPGGTAMITCGAISGRVQQRGADRMGRFTWMALRGRKESGIIAVTVYRVCQNSQTQAGEDTAYMQQHTAMREAGIKTPDPRNQVLLDVSDLLAEWGQRGFHPLVMIDANATWDERGLGKFARQHGLFDIIADSNEGTPPATYARGKNRIDFILGDQLVRRAVIHSGALALHDGVNVSDHTMQYVDFDENLLFGDDSFIPMAGYLREFRLFNVRRKKKFQDKLLDIYTNQKIRERVKILADLFQEAEVISPALILAYQKLDNEIEAAIKAAASAAGRTDFGYQRSEALCKAGETVRLHRSILSCVTRKADFTEKVYELGKKLNIPIPERSDISHKEARTNVNAAWKAKRQVEINDDVERSNWLEELAEEKAKEGDEDAATVLQRMVQAAKIKGMFKRMRAIFKPERSSLDYIEIPNERWFLTKDRQELYEFDSGIFLAHKAVEENLYESFSMIKVLPPDACAVEVESAGDMIQALNPDSIAPCTWKKITKPIEIEAWILRRNKRHLQQMYVEKSPPTTDEFAPILDDHGTSDTAKSVLDGTYDTSQLNLGPEMEMFLNSLVMTPEERLLVVPGMMSTEDFQDVMRNQKEDTSSSPSGLHYTLWKAIGEIKKLAEVHAIMISLPFMYGFVCDRCGRKRLIV